MLEAITQKVDRSAVRHPNGEKVARSFADRPYVLAGYCPTFGSCAAACVAVINLNNSFG